MGKSLESGPRHINIKTNSGMRAIPIVGASAEQIANTPINPDLDPRMDPDNILNNFLGDIRLSDLRGKPSKFSSRRRSR